MLVQIFVVIVVTVTPCLFSALNPEIKDVSSNSFIHELSSLCILLTLFLTSILIDVGLIRGLVSFLKNRIRIHMMMKLWTNRKRYFDIWSYFYFKSYRISINGYVKNKNETIIIQWMFFISLESEYFSLSVMRRFVISLHICNYFATL